MNWREIGSWQVLGTVRRRLEPCRVGEAWHRNTSEEQRLHQVWGCFTGLCSHQGQVHQATLPIVISPYQAQKGVSRERKADSKNKQQENHTESIRSLLHAVFLEGPDRKQVCPTSEKWFLPVYEESREMISTIISGDFDNSFWFVTVFEQRTIRSSEPKEVWVLSRGFTCHVNRGKRWCQCGFTIMKSLLRIQTPLPALELRPSHVDLQMFAHLCLHRGI